MTSRYILPSSPEIMCGDRFSILDSDELQVEFWPLFQNLLRRNVSDPAQVIDILETIAVTLRQKSDTDYGFLKTFMHKHLSPTFFTTTWPMLANLALRMPELFPDHSIHILSLSQPSLRMSREQTACLVVHQFFCTLNAPIWQEGYQDFDIWYTSEQPHSGAVEAYLISLFTYFERLASEDEISPLACNIEDWSITYTLHNDSSPSKHAHRLLPPLEVVYLPAASTAPEMLGLTDGAAVISANKFIGFGRTGTQEETHVGASPECCPAVLITPPLEDDHVLVVTGAEAMVSISGYGRDAYCAEILQPSLQDHRGRWAKRTMLFMDALELDLADRDAGLPDIASGNIEREIKKAFIGYRSSQGAELQHPPFSIIYTGFWGCRAFGGNPAIKAMLQYHAAAMAGCRLRFICSGEEQREFGKALEAFVLQMRVRMITPSTLQRALNLLKPSDLNAGQDPFKSVLGLMPGLPMMSVDDVMEQVPYRRKR